MSSTRLLVLGVVRFAQPVHGYDVRRELVSWRLDEFTNARPGSVYSALKTLEKDGLIAVNGVEQEQGRPERTEYVLTSEGESEFQILLRASWWRVQRGTEPLIPALCMMLGMPREELVAAVGSRISQLTGQVDELRFFRAGITDGATGAHGEVPEHVREILDFAAARTKAEIEWSRAFVKRLREGSYVFEDERQP
jgi:DNA-binding PadR family transcriptional regulator